MVGKHIFVAGRVQGVGFRYFTVKLAQNIGLKGWVRNLPDGRVEALALGNPEQLEIFLSSLAKGPPGSAVDDLSVQDVESDQALREFVIRHDGGPS